MADHGNASSTMIRSNSDCFVRKHIQRIWCLTMPVVVRVPK